MKKSSTNIVWTKTLLITESNRPLVSPIAHVIVKDESIYNFNNVDNKDNNNNTDSRTTIAFMQRTINYPETAVTFFLKKNFFNVTLNKIS